MNVVPVVLGLVKHDERWFLQRRDSGNAVLPGQWEFPGGKVGHGETLEAALHRELQEELAWRPLFITPLEYVEHCYAHRTVRLHPFSCHGAFEIRTILSWGWFTLDEMRGLPLPEANKTLLERLGRGPTQSPEIQPMRN